MLSWCSLKLLTHFYVGIVAASDSTARQLRAYSVAVSIEQQAKCQSSSRRSDEGSALAQLRNAMPYPVESSAESGRTIAHFSNLPLWNSQVTCELPASVQRKSSGCWSLGERSSPKARVCAMTCSRLEPGFNLALSMTALSTYPMGRLPARTITCVRRLKCSSTHISRAPAAIATPDQPYRW